jgi:uncharacterized protein (DUF1330 family)
LDKSHDYCHIKANAKIPSFLVIIEFPSLEKAYEWYNSDDYTELKALRLAAAESIAVFIEGM